MLSPSKQATHPPLSLNVFFRAVLDQNLFDDDSFLYEDAPELLGFRTATPSIELLTDWYQSRAKDIDSCSRQVKKNVCRCRVSLVCGEGMHFLQNQSVREPIAMATLHSGYLALFTLKLLVCPSLVSFQNQLWMSRTDFSLRAKIPFQDPLAGLELIKGRQLKGLNGHLAIGKNNCRPLDDCGGKR